jgi:cell division protein FtsB
LDAATEYPRALLGAIGLLAERSERIGDLATRAQWFADGKRELRKENDTLRKENKALRRENRKLRARPGIRSVVRRAYRRLSSSR